MDTTKALIGVAVVVVAGVVGYYLYQRYMKTKTTTPNGGTTTPSGGGTTTPTNQ
jgi:hypothetical protein